MKSLAFLFATLAFAPASFADVETPFSEVIVPILNDHPTGAAKQAGMMYLLGNQLYVVTAVDAPAIPINGTAATTISGTGRRGAPRERIERALVVCGGSSEAKNVSSPWIATVSNRSGDECVVRTVPGTFATTPVCFVSRADGKSGPSAVLVKDAETIRVFGVESGYDASLVCTGPAVAAENTRK